MDQPYPPRMPASAELGSPGVARRRTGKRTGPARTPMAKIPVTCERGEPAMRGPAR
jgi:hypothetical protein